MKLLKAISLLFLLTTASSCVDPSSLDFTSVNQISINDKGEIEIIGVSEAASAKKFIKSPFILILDKDLNYINTHTLKTKTTAQNPKLSTQKDGSKIVSFYRAASLDSGTESSHFISLDQNYKIKGQSQLGQRSRVSRLIETQSNSIAMIYQRGTKNIEFKAINGTPFSTKFSYNDEPTIPTDIELTKSGKLIFSGVQNGFRYPDGYDYKEKAAYGFIGELSNEGQVVKQSEYKNEQHNFYEDIEVAENAIIVTGTKQQLGTSMDLLLLAYNDSLSITQEKSFPKEGIQNGIKTIKDGEHYYILFESENLNNHKMNLSMIKSDLFFNTIWEKDFPSKLSHTPKDFIITDQKIYCITNTIERKGAGTQAELYVISLDGELISKKSIQ